MCLNPWIFVLLERFEGERSFDEKKHGPLGSLQARSALKIGSKDHFMAFGQMAEDKFSLLKANSTKVSYEGPNYQERVSLCLIF